MRCVTVENVRSHQAAFQAAADANGGTREAGSAGYDASAEYVVDELEDAGYDVTRQFFDFTFWEPLGPSTLTQNAPGGVTYVEDTDYTLATFTAAGTASAAAEAVDLDLGIGNSSSSGCESADFGAFTAGNIALIQRGACSFQQKAENAATAGASGVVIFNQGNTEDRKGLIGVTLSEDYSGGIPVVFATYDLGEEWAGTAGLDMTLVTDTNTETRTTYNVFADTRRGDDESVVMVGAHLDSVTTGPGIQDNGSGSATILEVAIQMRKVRPKHKVRFAWWGAEEFGLLGSDHYITDLFFNNPTELDNIALYLNFDMIGSPNYAYFIYDGDGDAFGLVGPDGSDHIEGTFEQFYGRRNLPSEPTAFDGRSDYAAFIQEGVEIPAGGLFTGAEGIKTADQVALYGGTAGEQYDPCYHLACDTFDNVSMQALDTNSDAVGYAVMTYAMRNSLLDSRPKRSSSRAGNSASVANGGFAGHGNME